MGISDLEEVLEELKDAPQPPPRDAPQPPPKDAPQPPPRNAPQPPPRVMGDIPKAK